MANVWVSSEANAERQEFTAKREATPEQRLNDFVDAVLKGKLGESGGETREAIKIAVENYESKASQVEPRSQSSPLNFSGLKVMLPDRLGSHDAPLNLLNTEKRKEYAKSILIRAYKLGPQ